MNVVHSIAEYSTPSARKKGILAHDGAKCRPGLHLRTGREPRDQALDRLAILYPHRTARKMANGGGGHVGHLGRLRRWSKREEGQTLPPDPRAKMANMATVVPPGHLREKLGVSWLSRRIRLLLVLAGAPKTILRREVPSLSASRSSG